MKPSRRHKKNMTVFEKKTGWKYSITCTNIPLAGIAGVPGSHHPQYIDAVQRDHATVETTSSEVWAEAFERTSQHLRSKRARRAAIMFVISREPARCSTLMRRWGHHAIRIKTDYQAYKSRRLYSIQAEKRYN